MGVWAYCLPLALVGCCTTEAVQPVVIPPSLTAPCEHDANPETNAELLDAYVEARTTIRECDRRLQSIRTILDDQRD